MKKVGIIGGSGFIGSYITRKFLKKGYNVKVSVTDIKKREKFRHLFNLKNSDNLNISEMKVEDIKDLEDFIHDCDILIHGGTPFQLDVKDPKTELFDPTIIGTNNFLKATSSAPSLEKVVFIASVAAFNTNFPIPAGGKAPADTYSETDDLFMSEESHPYAQAKYIAQRTVDKFIDTNPNLDFEITTVSPVMVMGKALSNREDSTSTGLQFLFKNRIAPNPFIEMLYENDTEFALVDVRDVARGVFKAATTSGLHGENYLLSSESYAVSDIGLMLNNKAPKNKAKIIYQNAKAANELEIPFQPVLQFLQE
jgi:hypothetical protein